MSPDDDNPEERRERGEEVLRKVRAMNRRDFAKAVERDKSSRTIAEIEAAYEQAMKEKREAKQ